LKTALIYVRQSRHKADERTVSPEVQEKACRSLPSVKDCDDVIVYRDLDLSGRRLKGRTGYAALVRRWRSWDWSDCWSAWPVVLRLMCRL
jgi:DNA invertase Pin-like site-specific DNA recombinase